MAKHKQSKRERKFAAKGNAKARLDKGEKLAPHGKVKRKQRRANTNSDGSPNKQQQQRKPHDQDYGQQQEALRQSEDFMGRSNLGDLDVGSFFANLQEDLMKDDASASSSDSDSDMGIEQEEEGAKVAPSQKKKKKKQTNANDNDEDDSSSSSEDSNNGKAKAPSKMAKNQTQKGSKSNDKDESSESDNDSSSDEDGSDDEKELPNAKTAKANNKKKKDESDSDDDDEDLEAAEARMKAEMKKLQSEDPEFHEFLQENEQSLLEFGDDDDSVDDDDDDDDDDGEPRDAKSKKQQKKEDQEDDNDDNEGGGKSIELTAKILKNLEHGAFSAHGIKSLKMIVRAYKSACQVASATEGEIDEGTSSSKRKKKNKKEKTFRIESSQVFDNLMVVCLNRCHEAFYYHLLATDEERDATDGATANTKKIKKSTTEEKKDDKKNKGGKKKKGSPKEESDSDDSDEEMEEPEPNPDEGENTADQEDSHDKPLDPNLLEKSPRWTDVKSILNTFLKSTLHLISESKEPSLLALVLKYLSKYVRYMTPFPRSAEALLKTLTDLWSAPLGDASADYQMVRLSAFLRIRQLALTQPFPFVELCLKKTYLAYARRAKFGGTASSIMTNALPTLTFMGNCVVELYSLDQQSSYQHAFVYIRQLALLLRTAMQKKTKEAFQQVYCWQYMHCLKLWVAVLSSASKQSGGDNGDNTDQLMRSLIYPLTEIILGTVRLAPSPSRHVPLRFHCVRLLQQLAAASETYIPTTSILLETLDLKELSMKPKKIKTKGGNETTRGVQMQFLLKLSKEDPLRTAEEHEACVAELFKLLNREVDLYRFSPGFPEFSIFIIQKLKKFMKSTKNSRWRAYARGCVDLCKRYTDFAVNARTRLAEAPRDVKRLECLRQRSDPSMSERYDAAVEKENTEWTSLIAASAAETRKAKANSANKGDDESDDAASDDEGEAEKTHEKQKKKRKKKRKSPADAPPAKIAKIDGTVMDIKDTIKEGVDWSSEEED